MDRPDDDPGNGTEDAEGTGNAEGTRDVERDGVPLPGSRRRPKPLRRRRRRRRPPHGGGSRGAPSPSPRRGRTKAVITVLAVVLALGASGGVGWHLWSRSQTGTISTSLVRLSDTWVAGAHEVWRHDVAAGTEVAVPGSHVLTVNDKDSIHRDPVITGYTASQEGLRKSWTTSLPGYGGRLDSDHMTLWGRSTAVYGPLLIDLRTGHATDAPWDADLEASVAGSVAISCDSQGTCTAWDENQDRLWSQPVAAEGRSDSLHGYTSNDYLPVIQHGDERFVVIGPAVVNLGTGEDLGLDHLHWDAKDSHIEPARDGWALISKDDSFHYTVTTYTKKGDRIESFSATSPDSVEAVLQQGSLRTLKQIRADLQGPASTTGVLITEKGEEDKEKGCIKTVVAGQRPLTLTGSRSKDDLCATEGMVSPGGSALVLYSFNTRSRSDSAYSTRSEFSSVMDLGSGREIDFPGTDWRKEAVYTPSIPNLVVGYNQDDGVIVAYAPGS